MDPRDFGARLRQYRQRMQLSITELARRTGVDYMQISRYEKGETAPALGTAIRLAAILKVSLDELATGTEPPPPLPFRNMQLLERIRQLDQLPSDRQEMALRVLDTVIAGYQLEDLSNRLRRS